MARAITPPVLAIASLACAPPRAPDSAATTRAPIAARLEIRSALDERARSACADEILGALRRRAIVVTEQGTPVHIELWLAQEIAAANFPNTAGVSPPRFLEVLPAPSAPLLAAELTATVHLAGAPPQVLRAAGTSASTPCAVAGERLADQLVALIGARRPPRSAFF